MIRRIGLLIGFCLIVSSAEAALELKLTQGIDAAMPVAITDFQSRGLKGWSTSGTSTDVAEVIRQDLQNSGRFRVMPAGSIRSEALTEEGQVNYGYWQHQGMDNVVVGSVQSLSGDNYRVTCQLLDVYRATASGKLPPHVVFQQQYTVSARGLRHAAHRLSDLIFQKLVGVPGAFSTRVAYVLVQRQQGRPVYRLQIADSDGYQPQTLVVSPQPIMSPSWAPDGRRLAYVTFAQRRSQVHVVDVASGSDQIVSEYPGINGAPAWSPDGRRLALVLTRTGFLRIYTLNLANRELTQLTTGNGPAIDTEPNWAPDGRSIIFTSDRGGSPQIYRVEVGSHQVSRVTYDGDYNARASFTPGGRAIVMLHRSGGMFNIAEQDLLTGRVRILTRAGSGKDESPSLAPNGMMVLYATREAGRNVLGMVSIDGRVRLRVPAGDGDVQEPAWSPPWLS